MCRIFQTNFNHFCSFLITRFKCRLLKLWLQLYNPVAKYSLWQVTVICVTSPLIETTGDPSMKATDSSGGAMQDASDKHHKKVHLLDLVACVSFILRSLPRRVLTQLQSAGFLSLYHGFLHLKHFKLSKFADLLWTILNSILVILQRNFILP